MLTFFPRFLLAVALVFVIGWGLIAFVAVLSPLLPGWVMGLLILILIGFISGIISFARAPDYPVVYQEVDDEEDDGFGQLPEHIHV